MTVYYLKESDPSLEPATSVLHWRFPEETCVEGGAAYLEILKTLQSITQKSRVKLPWRFSIESWDKPAHSFVLCSGETQWSSEQNILCESVLVALTRRHLRAVLGHTLEYQVHHTMTDVSYLLEGGCLVYVHGACRVEAHEFMPPVVKIHVV
jgi:hypothetical protein